ncbi:MAG: peptide deformylase [Candidatus Paceibacterota bacterium]|jgi:peptide deformylase
MNNLEIKKYPDPVLRKKCEEVEEITPEVKKLIEEMVLVMGKDKGMGLAAPQVGISKKIIVFETGNGVTALINPKITKRGEKQFIDSEGCLSFPDLWIKIKRPEKIEVEALDITGRKIGLAASMMVSRVLQHEIDHLNGILFIDRLGLLDKIRIRNKLNALKKKYAGSKSGAKADEK